MNFPDENQINHLNSILIVLSALAAWMLPLEVFLFSYAVLGPLHYFTEISWLHDRKYFSPSKWHSLPFYVLALVVLVANRLLETPIFGLVFLAFGFAFLLCFIKNIWGLIIGTLLLTIISQSTAEIPFVYQLFGVLLPTLIHVCVFTLFFMLLGSLKSSNGSAYLSVVVYMLCTFGVLVVPETTSYTISQSVFNASGNFKYLAGQINIMLERELVSENLIAAFRFIAFAYTYHYLNWFSKTRLINWHQISRQRLVCIILLWLSSISVYAYDYKTGLLVLFFFSLVHVFLEFPLNVLSMRELSIILWQKYRRLIHVRG